MHKLNEWWAIMGQYKAIKLKPGLQAFYETDRSSLQLPGQHGAKNEQIL